MQLASNLLWAGEDFLAFLVPSNRVHNRLEENRRDNPNAYVIPPIQFDEALLRETREELKEIAKVVKWQLNDTMAKDKQWLGITRLVTEDKWGPRPWTDLDVDAVDSSDQELVDQGLFRRPLIIGIMKEYVDALKSLPNDSEARLRATFLAAITMTHEIAHAVWHQDFRSLNYDTQGLEPYFDKDCVSELGLSFIAFIFGSYSPSSVDKQVPTNFYSPLTWVKVHTVDENDFLKWPEYAIPTAYIQEVLSQTFWDDLGKPGSRAWGPNARNQLTPQRGNTDLAEISVRQWTVSRYDGTILWKPNYHDRRKRDPKLLQNVTPEEKALAIAEIKQANPNARSMNFGGDEDDDEERFGGDEILATNGAASDSLVERPVDDGYLRMDLPGPSLSTMARIEVRYRPGSAMAAQANKRRKPHDYNEGVRGSSSKNSGGLFSQLTGALRNPHVEPSNINQINSVDDNFSKKEYDGEDIATWNDSDFQDFFRVNNLPVWGDKPIWMARHARYYDELNGSADRAKINYDSKGPIKRTVNDVEVYAWNACLNATTVAALKGELFTIGIFPANCTLNLYCGNDRQTSLQDGHPLDFYSPGNWKNLWLVVSLPKPPVVAEPSTPIQTTRVYQSRLKATTGRLQFDGKSLIDAPNYHHGNPLPVRAMSSNRGGGGGGGGGPTPPTPAVLPSLKRAYEIAHNNARPTVTERLEDISSSAAELAKIVLPQGGREILRPHLRSMRTTSAMEMLDSLEDLQEVREDRQHEIDMVVDPVKTLEEDRKKRLADLKTLFLPGTKFDDRGRVIGEVPGTNENGNAGRTRAKAGSHMADMYARLKPQG